MRGIWTAVAPFNQAAVSITGGTITGTNAARVLSQSGIPFIVVSSGSMGNNGALSGLTALSRTYSAGAYIWLPAGAIAAGVPASAAWYWCVFSSSTAGTVYNSTYTSGTPAVGVLTAFVTTGPGAFTGDTTEIAGPTITVPANTLGVTGALRISSLWQYTNSAGAKTLRVRYSGAAGTQYLSLGVSTTASYYDQRTITNAGVTNSQIGGVNNASQAGPWGASTTSATTSAVDTTAATTVVLAVQHGGAATDNAVLESYLIEVLANPA